MRCKCQLIEKRLQKTDTNGTKNNNDSFKTEFIYNRKNYPSTVFDLNYQKLLEKKEREIEEQRIKIEQEQQKIKIKEKQLMEERLQI